MKMLLCVNLPYTMERCRGYIESFEYDLLMMENWMENSIIFFMFGLEISFFFFDMLLYIYFLQNIMGGIILFYVKKKLFFFSLFYMKN